MFSTIRGKTGKVLHYVQYEQGVTGIVKHYVQYDQGEDRYSITLCSVRSGGRKV